MSNEKTKSKRHPRVGSRNFRMEFIAWPLELPWPPQGNEPAESFEQSVQELNEAELAKALANPGYIPVHKTFLLPPEGATLSAEDDSRLDDLCEAVAAVVARFIREELSR